MRILFTMTGGWGTGSGTVVAALADRLHDLGHTVGILYPDTRDAPDVDVPAPDAEHLLWTFPIVLEGVELYTFPLMIPDPNPANFDGAWTYSALTQAQLDLFLSSFRARLAEVVAAFRPDVIECQHVWAMPYAASELGLPYFVMAHHSDQMAFHQDTRMRPYATHAARQAENVFALSEGNKAEIVGLYGVLPEEVIVMGNGYDREVFRPIEVNRAALLAAHDLTIPAEAPLVTFAGKLSKTKGVDIILEANRLLRERLAVPPHLLLFGSGKLEETLDPNRPEAYSREGCHFLGHQPYAVVRDFHNAARLSIMPSRAEGFGLAALEAMGCGLPVVVTRLGGPDSYSVGPIIEPEEPEALADAMEAVLAMPDDPYAALCDEALRVARTFSWEAVVDKRLRYFREAPALPSEA
ncbi:MAG: glycosyltransferase [Rhodothermaceae bacterium]|nr:glycosyltransferase [Rhodothermaceae bacterium]